MVQVLQRRLCADVRIFYWDIIWIERVFLAHLAGRQQGTAMKAVRLQRQVKSERNVSIIKKLTSAPDERAIDRTRLHIEICDALLSYCVL